MKHAGIGLFIKTSRQTTFQLPAIVLVIEMKRGRDRSPNRPPQTQNFNIIFDEF